MNVTATSALTPGSEIDRIFGPVLQPGTYRHLLYEFISFPFGLLAFVLMISGLATGVGLAIILVGFVILAMTLAVGRLFGRIERSLASSLLGAVFPAPATRLHSGLRAGLTDPRSWTAAAYFILRFPLAVVGFAVSVVFLASAALVAAPLLYTLFPLVVDGERVTTSEQALLVSLTGCIVFLLSIHAINGLAALSRRMAMALL